MFGSKMAWASPFQVVDRRSDGADLTSLMTHNSCGRMMRRTSRHRGSGCRRDVLQKTSSGRREKNGGRKKNLVLTKFQLLDLLSSIILLEL
eukprot:SAG31_NODE_546_length_14230_cov_18.112660_2_plen_91_part_00